MSLFISQNRLHRQITIYPKRFKRRRKINLRRNPSSVALRVRILPETVGDIYSDFAVWQFYLVFFTNKIWA